MLMLSLVTRGKQRASKYRGHRPIVVVQTLELAYTPALEKWRTDNAATVSKWHGST